MQSHEQVFAGRFLITTDNFLLHPPGLDRFIDVSPDPPLAIVLGQRFDEQAVSIAGTMGERTLPGAANVPTIRARNIVLQDAIRTRAFEIYSSTPGGSASADWLKAEQELLRVPATA